MAEYKESASVTEDSRTYTITHNLNDATAVLKSAIPNWATTVYIDSKTANTIVVEFANTPPASATLDSVVET